jgi:Ca-activated chloride channel family protein
MSALTLGEPGALWWLVALCALAAAYVAVQLRRPRDAVRFTNLELLDVVAPERPAWRRHLVAVTFLLALGALVVAAARPLAEVEVAVERATVVLAIDVSRSMGATDVPPDRLRAAKAAARTFVEGLPPSLNVGIVAFDGVARLLVPPTTDRVAARDAIEGLEMGPATAIGEAIFTSLAAIEDLGPGPDGELVPAHIVVLSDGVTTAGRPDDVAAAAAAEAGVPVSTISFGTPFGEVFLGDSPEPVPVPVDPAALEMIAAVTGGTAFAADSPEGLEAVYEDIGSAIGSVFEEREVTHLAVQAALALFLVAAGLSLLFSPRFP